MTLPSTLRRRLFASVTLSPIDSRYSDDEAFLHPAFHESRRDAYDFARRSVCHLVAIAINLLRSILMTIFEILAILAIILSHTINIYEMHESTISLSI